MKTKTWAKVAFNCLLLGWFFFMWLSIWGSWNREYAFYVLLLGLSCCIFGSIMILPILRNDALFKSIEELETEKAEYREATRKLKRKILEL